MAACFSWTTNAAHRLADAAVDLPLDAHDLLLSSSTLRAARDSLYARSQGSAVGDAVRAAVTLARARGGGR